MKIADPWSHCRSPLCGKKLRSDNKSGFCRGCQSARPGGYWARRWYLMATGNMDRHRRTKNKASTGQQERRVAAGGCRACMQPIAPRSKSRCERCLEREAVAAAARRGARRAA